MTEEPTGKEIFRLKKYIEILEEDNKWCHSIINKLQQRGTKGSHTHTHRNLMTIRAEEIWSSFCNELIVEPTEDMKQALSYAIRICAERLCTDWGEMQHPSTVLEEIADELEAL